MRPRIRDAGKLPVRKVKDEAAPHHVEAADIGGFILCVAPRLAGEAVAVQAVRRVEGHPGHLMADAADLMDALSRQMMVEKWTAIQVQINRSPKQERKPQSRKNSNT